MALHGLKERTWRDEIADIGVLCLGVALVLAVVVIGVMFGDYFAGVLYRMGFQSAPVAWIAQITSFALTVGVVMTVGGRIVNGAWWFHD